MPVAQWWPQSKAVWRTSQRTLNQWFAPENLFPSRNGDADCEDYGLRHCKLFNCQGIQVFVLQPGVHSLVTSPSPSLGDNLGLFQRKNGLVSQLDAGGTQYPGHIICEISWHIRTLQGIRCILSPKTRVPDKNWRESDEVCSTSRLPYNFKKTQLIREAPCSPTNSRHYQYASQS